MNLSLQLCRAGWRSTRLLLWLTAVTLGTIPPNATFAAAPTNSWPSLAEVRKKWDATSMDSARQAAEQGDLTAQHYLGFCYATGERVETNAALSLSWYQRAGELGYLPSFNNLGVLYDQGRLVSHDPAKAIGYFRRAATGGMAQAQANLGFSYRNGAGVEPNAEEALKWFRLAADQGHTIAMVNVGHAYRFGKGVPKDAQTAIRWFQAADQCGDPLGTVNLGWMYGYVDESPQDEQKAFGLFLKAAEKGQLDAMYELYLAYENARGVASDAQKATTWLVKAAEAGNPMAQAVYGGRFAGPPFNADPLKQQPKNMPEAVRWYQLSADQGYSGGEYRLGLCYLEADGVEQDAARGLELIRRAADQGYTKAMRELAGLYARGIGEPRNNLDRPLEILKRASAYDELVFRYQYGVGTERDLVATAEWYCRANAAGLSEYSLKDKLGAGTAISKLESGASYVGSPERSSLNIRSPDFGPMSEALRQVLSVYLLAGKSNPAALAEIGHRYLTGRGVPKNQRSAWLWLTLAQHHGSAGVRPSIAEIETRMTRAEIEETRSSLPKLAQQLSEVSRSVRDAPSQSQP